MTKFTDGWDQTRHLIRGVNAFSGTQNATPSDLGPNHAAQAMRRGLQKKRRDTVPQRQDSPSPPPQVNPHGQFYSPPGPQQPYYGQPVQQLSSPWPTLQNGSSTDQPYGPVQYQGGHTPYQSAQDVSHPQQYAGTPYHQSPHAQQSLPPPQMPSSQQYYQQPQYTSTSSYNGSQTSQTPQGYSLPAQSSNYFPPNPSPHDDNSRTGYGYPQNYGPYGQTSGSPTGGPWNRSLQGSPPMGPPTCRHGFLDDGR